MFHDGGPIHNQEPDNRIKSEEKYRTTGSKKSIMNRKFAAWSEYGGFK
jgi:hypothetical protein